VGGLVATQSDIKNKVNYNHELSTSEFYRAHKARLVRRIRDAPQINREPGYQQ